MQETKEIWSKGDLKIIYSNPSIYAFNESEICMSMEEFLYFYYDVTVLNGEKELFSSRIGTAPLVHYLPEEIDKLLSFDMKKALIVENYKDDDFERVVRYTRICMDGGIRYDYFYKMEREDIYLKMENIVEESTEYTLTIGNTGEVSKYEDTPEHGLVVEIRGLTKEDVLALKETALGFCKKTLEQHAEGKRGE